MPRITKAEWQLIWEAMSHAIDERESFRECCTPSHGDITDEARAVMKSCDDFIEKADKFCVKHFGQKSHSTQWREKMDATPRISIFKILAQENSVTLENYSGRK
jgi:hypothetical protein